MIGAIYNFMQDYDEPYDPFNNNIECSTPFIYPEFSMREEVALQISSSIQEVVYDNLTTMLNKLANYVIPSPNPRMTLVALLYASNMDLSYILQCDNTMTSIAKRLGVGKQSFSTELQKIRKDFGLVHSTTIKHGVTQTTYANNVRKIKP